MSEKQFVLYEHKGDYYILKNPRLHLDFIEMLGDALIPEEIVGELNQLDDKVVKLEEENEQLKETNKKLQQELDKTREDLNYFTNLKVGAMRGNDCGHDRFYVTSMQKKR